MAEAEDPLEGFPELWVEYRVDDRVEAGIEVTQEGGGLGKGAGYSLIKS